MDSEKLIILGHINPDVAHTPDIPGEGHPSSPPQNGAYPCVKGSERAVPDRYGQTRVAPRGNSSSLYTASAVSETSFFMRRGFWAHVVLGSRSKRRPRCPGFQPGARKAWHSDRMLPTRGAAAPPSCRPEGSNSPEKYASQDGRFRILRDAAKGPAFGNRDFLKKIE